MSKPLHEIMNAKGWLPFWLFIFTCSAGNVLCVHYQDHLDQEALRAFDAELERLDAHNLTDDDIKGE